MTSSALILAHPGHELRVHHWVERTRPLTFILTDGSGHGTRGRIESSREILTAAGAEISSVFGHFTDREAYELLLECQVIRAQDLVLEIVDQLVDSEVDTLASDAIEGYNPIHDLCFVIAHAAGRIAGQRLGSPIQHYDFPLEASPSEWAGFSDGGVESTLRLELDEAGWQRKLRAAEEYGLLRDEVERAMETYGAGSFRLERLRLSPSIEDLIEGIEEPTQYEAHGRRRVAEGFYDQVLTFREHFLPLAQTLMTWAPGT